MSFRTCQLCRHWDGERDASKRQAVIDAYNATKPAKRPSLEFGSWVDGFPFPGVGKCTLYPTWLETDAEHFCGQYVGEFGE